MDRWKATALVLMGVLLGVVFAGPRTTGADGHEARQFKECVAYQAMTSAGRLKGLEKHALPVPEGWAVIGGIGGALLLCR